MATIQKRKSRGQTYWYLVESRRVNGKPRPITLAYLGKANDLLERLQGINDYELKSYSHGDTAALLSIAKELGIVDIINRHIPAGKDGKKPMRDNLTVGGSFLLAAIGRASHPTSKRGWYEWCRESSLEYALRASFKKLDSQHFWDQMGFLPSETIPLIEEEIIRKLISAYNVKLDCLFFDTTNFFTFIDSSNERCKMPRRGHNKQKRTDLRQIGMALLVSRKEQFPLFHKTYHGDQNDSTLFKGVFESLVKRIKRIAKEVSDVTIIFDKGNNSKENFKMLDNQEELYYVGGLVACYFKDLIKEANKNFQTMSIAGEELPVYRLKKKIWGEERTCVVTISEQLREGQIRGIHQHLDKKYKLLEELKRRIENPKRRKTLIKEEIEDRLKKAIRGQFVEEILKVEFFKLSDGAWSFHYFIDLVAFDNLKKEVLGRKILVTNRHNWSVEEIILAYRGQSNVEFAFRNLKNPYHLAIRPQHHWTDQKIEAHILICMIGYLLAMAAYTKARRDADYKRNISNFLEDLRSIRLTSKIEKRKEGKRGKLKVGYRLEQIRPDLQNVAEVLGITEKNLRPELAVGVYKS